MTEQIMITIIACIISSLVTYFLKTVFINKEIKAHEKECDKNRRLEKVEVEFKEGAKRFERIERALVWLVVRQGGNPNDLGVNL